MRRLDPNTLKYDYYSINCDIKEFGKFGAGLQLYFKFQKQMAFVFLGMFILALPSMSSNINGDYLHEYDSMFGILKTTLAN